MGVSAREAVLAKIRAAKGGASHAAAVREGWNAVAREYIQSATRERAEVLDLLVDRLLDYDAQVVRVSRDGVRDAVGRMLAARGVKRMVVPAGMPAEVLPEGVAFVVDDGLSAVALDGFDGVVTGSTLAIAETGTVVLQNVSGQGRRAVTLVPDYHLCVVQAADVVETVSEAMERLGATSGLTTTFFSGPSATADIEMTRIKGVHGPRFLDVVVVE